MEYSFDSYVISETKTTRTRLPAVARKRTGGMMVTVSVRQAARFSYSARTGKHRTHSSSKRQRGVGVGAFGN
jgi:hypothetical protein